MSNSFVKEKDQSFNLTKEKGLAKETISEKKPLKEVLSSYLEKKQNKKRKNIKKDFSDIKTKYNETKTSFETLLEIQQTIKNAYKRTQDGEKKEQKE